jgi:DNA invertase Pin-like site-specific DNA recombinase
MSAVIAYLRVSTEEQHLGPEAQRQAIDRWLVQNGHTLKATFEENLSGGTPLDRRPGLAQALAALEAGDILVVARRDRLARDLYTVLLIEREVERRKARVISAAGEGTEANDPTQLMVRRITDVFAEFERNLIKGRTKGALMVKKSRGERIGTIPYGSQLHADGIHLEPRPDELAILERLIGLRAQGVSYRVIADLFNAETVPCRGTRWHKTTLHRLATGLQTGEAPSARPS